MTPPYLTPRLHRLPNAAEPAAGPVALEVRLGTGRPVRYELEGAEFTIGAAADCDVRLPGAGTPPRVCSVTRTADALYARRLDQAFPVLWNDRFLAPDAPTRLGHGDRVAVGPLDVTVHLAGVYLHPDLGTPAPDPAADVRPPRADPHAAPPRPEPPPTYGPDATARLAEVAEVAEAREALQRDRDALAAQARELEEDRVLWYRRRQEMEAEAARPAAPGPAEELAAREAELARFRDELTTLRDRLAAEYQERRDQLTQGNDDAAAARAEADARAERLAAEREQFAVELARFEGRQREQDRRAAETDAKAERLARDAQEFREQLDRAAAEHGQRADDAGRHDARAAELAARGAGLDAAVTDVTAREADLERRSARLREVGKLVAAQKRELAGERQAWLAEQSAERERQATARAEFAALHEQARRALDQLASAREILRGHLGELHADAGRSRDGLHAEAARLDAREQALEAARAAHGTAVTEFDQQRSGWQAELADARARAAAAAAAESAAPRGPEPAAVPSPVEESPEADGDLRDLREWYRRKLKGAVAGATGLSLQPPEEPEPGDRQLGERLRALDLVDAGTLTTLWGEARRQRRTLRTVLLAGGAVTLYQLAMMEAGDLGSLMLGRLRVLDRLRVTPREVVYRVVDPERAGGPTRGVFTLRHLAEAEMDDAVRPDEFRQMFTAARDAAHPNLAGTVEVLELHSRPAALLDFVPGLPASDWPAVAATPGAWVKLVLEAARGLDAAHRHGLTHGRISSESFVLTAAGEVKVVGVGEPMWLSTGVAAALDPTPEADLRALGQVAYGWSQLGQPGGKRKARGKGFPEALSAVVGRLEADPETPMADTASGAIPYRTAADLVHDLTRLAAIFPCPPEAQAALADAVAESLGPVRQSA